MGGETKEDIKNPVLDKAKFLWDEYRYRHELCWKLIFQITTAAVAILIIPYIKKDITTSVGLLIVALPALAIILVLFSMSCLNRELEILDKIRAKHRELQKEIFNISYEQDDSKFARNIRLYLIGLVVVGVLEIIALVCIWLPSQ